MTQPTEDDAATAEHASRFAALGDRPYRAYWLGSLASVGSTQLLILGQGWLVFELSASTLDLGLLGAASSAPTILVSFLGGVLADRVDRRKLLIALSVVNALLLAALAALDAGGIVEVWHVLTVATLMAIVFGLEFPTRQAYYPSLIQRRNMMSAVALNSMLWQGTRMILPALGGVLIAWADTSAVFVLSAVGYLAMTAVLLTLSSEPVAPSSSSSRDSIKEGLRFIAEHRLFKWTIALSYAHMFFGLSYVQLMPVFADRLGVAEAGFGALVSATGVGSVIGTLIVGGLQRTRHLGLMMLAGMLLTGLLIAGFALVVAFAAHLPHAYELGMALVTAAAACSSVFLITSMTVLQLRVPDALRGRVMGIHAISFSLIPLGGLFGGTLATWIGAPGAVMIGAALTVLAVFAVLMTQPEIAGLDGRDTSSD